MQISGNKAIVTGGASGLGLAAVRMIHAAGGVPVVIDWNEQAGNAIAAELGIEFHKADVSDAATIEAIIKQAAPVRILINAAGIGISQRVVSKEGPAPLDGFERVIRVNLIGTYNCIRLAAAAIATNDPDQGGERGVIINTASIAAYD